MGEILSVALSSHEAQREAIKKALRLSKCLSSDAQVVTRNDFEIALEGRALNTAGLKLDFTRPIVVLTNTNPQTDTEFQKLAIERGVTVAPMSASTEELLKHFDAQLSR